MQRLSGQIFASSAGRLHEVKNNGKSLISRQAQKVVPVAYRRLSFTEFQL